MRPEQIIAAAFDDAAERESFCLLLDGLPDGVALLDAGKALAEAVALPALFRGEYGTTDVDVDGTIEIGASIVLREAQTAGTPGDLALCSMVGFRGAMRLGKALFVAARKMAEAEALMTTGQMTAGALAYFQAADQAAAVYGVPASSFYPPELRERLVAPPVPIGPVLHRGRSAAPLRPDDLKPMQPAVQQA